MNDNTDVLRVEENGVELFTVVATGDSAVSQRGLARMAGVPETTVRRWFSDLRHESVPAWLKPLQLIDLHLRHEIKKRGKLIKPISAKFASKFISLVARNLKTDEAFDTLDAIGEIGLTSYIQAKTGWLPNEYQSSQESRNILDLLILAHAEKRSIHFDEEWQKEACRVTTYQWDGMPMAKFIRRSVYDLFPRALVKKLEDVNPYANSKRRENKHYQHFEKNLDENVLKQHIRDVLNILKLATSLKHFWQLMSDRFGDGIQLDLDL
jgi:hypothetical protein